MLLTTENERLKGTLKQTQDDFYGLQQRMSSMSPDLSRLSQEVESYKVRIVSYESQMQRDKVLLAEKDDEITQWRVRYQEG